MSEPPITLIAGSYGHYSNGIIARIVIHDEEYDTGPGSAEAVASYFHKLGPTGYASSHYIEDSEGEEHCVPEAQVAYHAPPNSWVFGGDLYGSIGIEQDGYAHYSLSQWRMPGAWATICRAAARSAELCIRYSLPVVWLSPEDLVAGRRGITSHLNVSLAFRQSDHTDPGLQYPVAEFIDMVKQGVALLSNVRTFQASNGLLVDGDPGIYTTLKLGEVLFTGPVVPPLLPPRDVNRFASYPTIQWGAKDPYPVSLYTPKAPVQALQNALNIVMGMESPSNPNRLTPDGNFGGATNNVLRVWQAQNYLSVDGIAGPQAWALLDHELDAKGR